MKETESSQPTPEQLLQILDAQLAAQRAQRPQPPRNRAIILVSGFLFIMGIAGVALFILSQMLQDMRGNNSGYPYGPAKVTQVGK